MSATLRPGTLEHYQRDLESHVVPYLGKKMLSQVTAADLRKPYDSLKKNGRLNPRPGQSRGLSSPTVHGIHTTLHHALRVAVEQGLLPGNPANEVEPPKIICQPMNILNEEQLGTFMDTIKTDPTWHDFFYTELTTGLRLGEICGLMWTDFDGRAGTLHIRRTLHRKSGGRFETGETKTGRGRRKILLPQSTADILRARQEAFPGKWIFSNPLKLGQPVFPDAAYRRLKSLLREAGTTESIPFHGLRYTFATHALASGVDAKILSGILGHTDAAFTLNTYTHVTGDMQKQAAAIVGNFMEDILERS